MKIVLARNILAFFFWNNTTWWRQWRWKLHGKWIWSCDLIWSIKSFRINWSCDSTGYTKLTNRRLCNYMHCSLPVWDHKMTSYIQKFSIQGRKMRKNCHKIPLVQLFVDLCFVSSSWHEKVIMHSNVFFQTRPVALVRYQQQEWNQCPTLPLTWC